MKQVLLLCFSLIQSVPLSWCKRVLIAKDISSGLVSLKPKMSIIFQVFLFFVFFRWWGRGKCNYFTLILRYLLLKKPSIVSFGHFYCVKIYNYEKEYNLLVSILFVCERETKCTLVKFEVLLFQHALFKISIFWISIWFVASGSRKKTKKHSSLIPHIHIDKEFVSCFSTKCYEQYFFNYFFFQNFWCITVHQFHWYLVNFKTHLVKAGTQHPN